MAESLVTVWVCISLAIVIMVSRLLAGRFCKSKWDIGDSLTVIAIFCALVRIAFTHVILIWMTNNISIGYRESHVFGAGEVYRREMGAKFTLVARCLYIVLLWIQKCVLLVFYGCLVKDMPWGKRTLIVFVAIFAVTFCVSIIVTFVGCHPFHLYWQVIPDPGECVRALTQLYVVGITNICTDLMLILLPVPVLLKVRLTTTKKLQLGVLFCAGFLIIIMTAVRIPLTVRSSHSETTRISWTTAEFLVATFVANAPILYSFRHRFKRRTNQPLRRFSPTAPHIRVYPMTDIEDVEGSKTEIATTQVKHTDSSGNTGTGSDDVSG